MKQGKVKKIVIGILILLVVVVGLLFAYNAFKPVASKGAKKVIIAVVDNNKQETDYTIHTDAETLKQVMDEVDGLTYSGDDSDYGLMISTVNGITADFNADGAYWAFYVNNEYCNYGIEEQPVNDKDEFKIEYTTGQ